MSASEKLQALEANDGPESVILTGECPFILFDALPQIVAVVEAAEDMADVWKGSYGELDGDAAFAPIRRALTALEEALQGDVT